MRRTTASALRRTSALTASAALAVGALAGCGSPPWNPSDPAETPTPTATAAEQPVPNDLSSGSTQRSMTAGPLDITIDYWSDLTMDKWTPDALKPVSLSLGTTVTPDNGQKVYLQRASMTAVPATGGENLDALEAQVDSATTNPGYLVLSPYSYTQTFTVGPVPKGTTHVTLQFSYEFLVQTTPTSSEYAKQTATEVVTVAITP